MRILVTGRNGQLAAALAEARADLDILPVARPEFDLADPGAIENHIKHLRPDIVVNAAAYTAVDRAEAEPEAAMAANAFAPGMIAGAAAAAGLPIIHISTDFVFGGEQPLPYREDDATAPLSVYGRSKLAGEIAVAAANPRHVILRTAWVFSHSGHNFLRTMLRLAATNREIRVVADQFGCPTYAPDLAEAILVIARELVGRAADDPRFGTYHLVGAGDTSWAGFATAIFSASRGHGGPAAIVEPIPTSGYPTPARRPANSRLDCAKARMVFGVALPFWAHGVDRCITRLARDGSLGSARA